MISNGSLQHGLRDLAAKGSALDKQLGHGEDLPDATLAGAVVEVGKLSDRLAKLQRQVGRSNGDCKK